MKHPVHIVSLVWHESGKESCQGKFVLECEKCRQQNLHFPYFTFM